MTSSSRKRTTAERMLLDVGIDPKDMLVDGFDSNGYLKFGPAPKGFDGESRLEEGVIRTHRVPWPEGFDYEKFEWAISVMDLERRTGVLSQEPVITQPPVSQIHWADASQYRTYSEQIAAYYTWSNRNSSQASYTTNIVNDLYSYIVS